ncbi:MAG: M23 family metallopeptidase [Desulfomonilaceae bacterium]
MKGKVYLVVGLSVVLLASCSSSEGIGRKEAVSRCFDPRYLAHSLGRLVPSHKAPLRLASLVSESCEQGALAGFFNSQARLASVANSDLPTREFKFPVKYGVLSSPFGFRHGRYHSGVDITAKRGDPVFACADGIVTAAGYQRDSRGLGILVTLNHGKGIFSDYAHLSSALVRPGQKIHQGQKIGLIGSTGRASCSHLHLQVRNGSQFYDPMIFFNQSELSGIEVADSFLTPVRERFSKMRKRLAHAR